MNIDPSLSDEIISGLKKNPKQLPPKLFYDEKGSKLFEQISELDEYYPTRTELKIMEDNIEEIVSALGEKILLVEFGSGSSLKTRLLLDHLKNLSGYVPIDISSDHLIQSAEKLKKEYPYIKIYPLAADFTLPFQLPAVDHDFNNICAYYPGSSIGNLTPEKAKLLLKRISDLAGSDGSLLIGIDLIKDKRILEAAYNDSKGITAEFNLNILNNLNKFFNADFQVRNFRHYAFYNEEECRIEMHLVSKDDQIVKINGNEIQFSKDEHIVTEYSYKYSVESFIKICSDYFSLRKCWTDSNNYFAVIYAYVINSSV